MENRKDIERLSFIFSCLTQYFGQNSFHLFFIQADVIEKMTKGENAILFIGKDSVELIESIINDSKCHTIDECISYCQSKESSHNIDFVLEIMSEKVILHNIKLDLPHLGYIVNELLEETNVELRKVSFLS